MENEHSVTSNLEGGRPPLLDRWLHLPAGWVLVAAIVLLQWGTFTGFANREITWAYPAHFDQTGYLGLSYQTFEQMLNQGLLSGIWSGLTAPVPQGNLIHVQAALLFLLRGPSRLSALTLNWLYLILFECAVVYTLRWLSQRWSVAFIGLGLLLTTTARFADAGGMMDFRIDFIAFCLYGTFLCTVVRSEMFESFWWSIAVGVTIALMILFRHLTAVSIGLVMLAALAFMGVRAFSQRRNSAGTVEGTRIKGIVLSGLVALLLAAPTLWTTRAAILHYYTLVITTDEGKMRDEEFQVTRTADFLLYYPRSLPRDHLGKTAIATLVLILAVTLPALIRTPRKTWRALSAPFFDPVIALFFLGTAFIVPFIVLTVYPSRSPVVGSFLVPPVIGAVLAMVVAFGRAGHGRPWTTPVLVSLSTIVLSAGIYTDLSASSHKKALFVGRRDDMRQLGELYDEIGTQSVRWGLSTPRVAWDRVRDYLHSGVLRSWFYERHGTLISPINALQGILPVTADQALAGIDSCDFAVLTDPSSQDDPGFQYPFNRSMKELYPKVRAAAEQQLIPIRHFEAFSQSLTLYMRVPLRLEGVSGGWITSRGVVVVGPGEMLRDHPTIELRGRNALFEHLGNSLSVRAELQTPGQPPRDVPATITPPGPEYSLVIHLDNADIRADQDVRVKLMFDKYWVPRDVGLNEDTRQLVIMAPTQLRATPNP